MTKRNTNVKTPPLTIVIDDARWKSERGLMPKLAKAAHVALGGLPEKIRPLAKRAQFTLLLTSDKTVKELNHDFRGINKPTNVLSFPQFTRAQVGRFGKGKGPVYVGDIAIAYRYTVDEARKDNKILSGHVTHLLIHGLLHLFGYDHLTAAAAARMERLETKLMADLGLPDPYAPVAIRAKSARTAKRKRV